MTDAFTPVGGAPVHQLLLTRFNVRAPALGSAAGQPAGWLDTRLGLFERYCAPSVVAQTEEDFDWVVFCDPATPEAVLRRIRAVDPRIRIAFLGNPARVPAPPEGGVAVVPDLRIFPHVRPGAEVVVGTRLDNDDALNRHALARVRGLVPVFLALGHEQWLHNPRLGYKLDHASQRLYLADSASSPFLTLFERVGGGERPAGPLVGNHSTLPDRYPTFQDAERRFWVKVVHGGNVDNRIDPTDPPVDLAELDGEFLFPRGERDGGGVLRRLRRRNRPA
jgi:hypothetical protein